MVWNRLPKQVIVGSDVLYLGIYHAVSHFNTGASASVKKVRISSGDYCSTRCTVADQQRVKSANRKSEEHTKKKRKIGREEKKAKGDKQ